MQPRSVRPIGGGLTQRAVALSGGKAIRERETEREEASGRQSHRFRGSKGEQPGGCSGGFIGRESGGDKRRRGGWGWRTRW